MLLRAVVEAYFRLSRDQSFNPSWWGVLVNPFFTSRRHLSREIRASAAVMRGGVLLDVGCGTKPYRRFFDVHRYWGVDIRKEGGWVAPACDIVYDGRRLPFASGRLDHVILTEVLEHVFEPRELLGEIHRILKPGGHLLVTVPFVWEEHEQPYDYGRYTSFGLRHLLAESGFSVIGLRKSANHASSLGQLISSWIYGATAAWHFAPRALLHATVCAPVLLLAEGLGRVARADQGLYLDNVAVAVKRADA